MCSPIDAPDSGINEAAMLRLVVSDDDEQKRSGRRPSIALYERWYAFQYRTHLLRVVPPPQRYRPRKPQR